MTLALIVALVVAVVASWSAWYWWQQATWLEARLRDRHLGDLVDLYDREMLR